MLWFYNSLFGSLRQDIESKQVNEFGNSLSQSSDSATRCHPDICNLNGLECYSPDCMDSALHWERVEGENYDKFGRSVESYGRCRSQGNVSTFLIPLAVLNLLLLVLATYQSYKARSLPMEFSETKFLFLSMISLSETLLLGSKSPFPETAPLRFDKHSSQLFPFFSSYPFCRRQQPCSLLLGIFIYCVSLLYGDSFASVCTKDWYTQ